MSKAWNELERRQNAFSAIRRLVEHMPTGAALAVVTSYLTVKQLEKLAEQMKKRVDEAKGI